MANKLPPQPVGALPGSSFWNDWIEKMRSLINDSSSSTGTGDVVRRNGASIDNASITAPMIIGPVVINSNPTFTGTAVLAKLTGVGTNGSLTFSDGICINYTPPT